MPKAYAGAETIPGMDENALPFGRRNGAADEKRRETFRGNPILCGVLNPGLSSLLIRLSACAAINTARERRFGLRLVLCAYAAKRRNRLTVFCFARKAFLQASQTAERSEGERALYSFKLTGWPSHPAAPLP